MQLVFRPSIWLKLAIFVGVLVVLASGVLIWTAYLFARDMLVDQIHERLTVTASDRQAMLLAYIHQQQERLGRVASRARPPLLLEEWADDNITGRGFRTGTTPLLSHVQDGAGDFLIFCRRAPR